MKYLIKPVTWLLTLACFTTFANSQQSTPIQSTRVPNSMAPLSKGIPKLEQYTARGKSSEVTYSHSTVRLIAGKYDNGVWTAGVEIVLAPGWKTYWRVPGDAGVPSEFIWKNSVNIKSAEVSWPAPKRYEDITGKSTGYKKHVVFPVTFTAKDANLPAKAELKLYYAICSDICVPAQANLSLNLPMALNNLPSLALIERFAATVPSQDTNNLKVNKLQAVSIAGKSVLAVTLSGKIAAKTDILVEGFDESYFDAPKLVSHENGKQIFHLLIDGLEDPAKLTGKTLKLTILSGENRLETNQKVN